MFWRSLGDVLDESAPQWASMPRVTAQIEGAEGMSLDRNTFDTTLNEVARQTAMTEEEWGRSTLVILLGPNSRPLS